VRLTDEEGIYNFVKYTSNLCTLLLCRINQHLVEPDLRCVINQHFVCFNTLSNKPNTPKLQECNIAAIGFWTYLVVITINSIHCIICIIFYATYFMQYIQCCVFYALYYLPYSICNKYSCIVFYAFHCIKYFVLNAL
jgi:hypothetical protein